MSNETVTRFTREEFNKEKRKYFDRIAPMSILPAALANIFIIIGSDKTEVTDDHTKACDFPIPVLLIVTGCASIGIFMLR